MAKNQELVDARHGIGLYSIRELCDMFGCGRYMIDFAINSHQLKYMSPNNKSRFVYLKDFLEYMEKEKGNIGTGMTNVALTQDALRKTSC